MEVVSHVRWNKEENNSVLLFEVLSNTVLKAIVSFLVPDLPTCSFQSYISGITLRGTACLFFLSCLTIDRFQEKRGFALQQERSGDRRLINFGEVPYVLRANAPSSRVDKRTLINHPSPIYSGSSRLDIKTIGE